MNDWGFAQTDPSQELARVHTFAIKKVQDGQDILFNITVHEYHTPARSRASRSFAQADKARTNQKESGTLHTPSGLGPNAVARSPIALREGSSALPLSGLESSPAPSVKGGIKNPVGL